MTVKRGNPRLLSEDATHVVSSLRTACHLSQCLGPPSEFLETKSPEKGKKVSQGEEQCVFSLRQIYPEGQDRLAWGGQGTWLWEGCWTRGQRGPDVNHLMPRGLWPLSRWCPWVPLNLKLSPPVLELSPSQPPAPEKGEGREAQRSRETTKLTLPRSLSSSLQRSPEPPPHPAPASDEVNTALTRAKSDWSQVWGLS